MRCAPLAAPKAMAPAVCTTPTTHSWPNVRTPKPAAAGTLARAAKRTTSALIITGRLRRYSTPAPIPLPTALTEYAPRHHRRSRLTGCARTRRS